MTITSLMQAPGAVGGSAASGAQPRGPAAYGFDEVCSILVGWRRRDAVLRMLSADSAVVGGVAGLRPGDSVRLVLHREDVTVHDCRVARATLEGVELSLAGARGALQ